MKSFIALIEREFLEHRGAFFIAPLVITAVLMAMTLFPWFTGRIETGFAGQIPLTEKLYEIGYLIAGGLWMAYLVIALFFYHADAFWADRRNNAILFWKSMPQSDLRILLSKVVAGLTLFPAIIIVVIAFAGVWLYLMLLVAGLVTTLDPAPGIAEAATIYGNVTLVIAVFLALTVLWYLPVMAWVGSLSTLVGRWSMPLAALVPALLVLTENLIGLPGAPAGGYLWTYLSDRLQLDLGEQAFDAYIVSVEPLNAGAMIVDALMRTDWMAMVIGWIFALVAVYAASEYRRRRTDL